jgi:signal transduction histidine kinase
MRAVWAGLTAVGAVALVATVAVDLARGDPSGAGWMLVGPGPYWAAGVIGAWRQPGRRAWLWLLAAGAFFMAASAGDDILTPPVAGGHADWLFWLARNWLGGAAILAGLGMIGLFPTGRTEKRYERWVLGTSAAVLAVVPLVLLITGPFAVTGPFGPWTDAGIASPLYWPATAALHPAATEVNTWLPVLTLLGLLLLYLRYRRAVLDARRRIRWLLLGALIAAVCFFAMTAVSLSPEPGVPQNVVYVVLFGLTEVILIGSLTVALGFDGVLGIDRAGRRTMVHRGLWLVISLGYAAGAASAGLLASHFLPAGPSVLIAAGAALVLQPLRRQAERAADRWVLGARLDGYDVLTRFGSMLEDAPGPADLLPALASAVQRGLGLQWARVRLDLVAANGSLESAGAAGIGAAESAEPELVVPLTQAGTVLGRIECGPRQDGPLLDEDRRLLASLAGQAATAVRNLHLTAELSARLEVIRTQARQLAASRARMQAAQDTERQRIQRDLHDGVQQDIVALTAKLALALARQRRGDSRADESLAEVQRDLAALLGHLREFAHAIHPPVLADKGLLEAIEAQAARLPIEVVIEAEPALRGVRFPPDAEAAAWFVVAEALTNTVKHAAARRVQVTLGRLDGRLAVAVSDDGRGFDPAAARGLGLSSLADRMSIVGGTLRIDSRPGAGSTLHAEVPLAAVPADGGPGPGAAAEPGAWPGPAAWPVPARAAEGSDG